MYIVVKASISAVTHDGQRGGTTSPGLAWVGHVVLFVSAALQDCGMVRFIHDVCVGVPYRTMLSSIGCAALRRPGILNAARAAAPALMRRNFMASMDDYGTHLFKGSMADSYLAKQGLPAGLLDDPTWTTGPAADGVAKAIMEWAGDKGASVFTHWFQPLGASGVRLGMTGQVHNAFFAFGADGKPTFSFKGKELLKVHAPHALPHSAVSLCITCCCKRATLVARENAVPHRTDSPAD